MRHLLLSLTLAVPCACSTVSTTEIRYVLELVQYVTVPAGDPAGAEATAAPASAEAERDEIGLDDAAARLRDVRALPASAPIEPAP